MKILIDVNLTPDWTVFLTDAGFESTHWTQVGDPSAPDTEIMEHARAGGFVVFTHDLDFGRLLALTRATGPSVLQLRTQDTFPSAMGNTVLLALKAHTAALEEGALITVNPRTSRVRVLPILP